MSGLKIGDKDVKGLYLGDMQIMGGNAENHFIIREGYMISDGITIIFLNNSDEIKNVTVEYFGYSEECIIKPNSVVLIKANQDKVSMTPKTAFKSQTHYILADDSGAYVSYGSTITAYSVGKKENICTADLGSEGAVWVFLIYE